MADRIRYEEGGIDLPLGAQSVVEVPTVLRARLTGLLFEANKNFLLPEGEQGMRRLNELFEQNRRPQLLISGHTDRVFTAEFNLTLSEERAAAIAAYLRDDVDVWLRRYDASVPEKKRWGVREDQFMLLALKLFGGPVSGEADDAYVAAVRQFQESKGLSADGKAGPQTRRALIEAYMKAPGTTLPPGAVLRTHGCGESHPEVPTDDGVEEPRNRRVEIFLFRGEIDPQPQAKCPPGGCAEYEKWKAAAGRTIDLSQPTEKPVVLAFGIEAAAAGDPNAVKAPSGKFVFNELHVEREDGDFTLAWQVRGDFKAPLTLRTGKKSFAVDAKNDEGGGVKTGSKSDLHPDTGGAIDATQIFTLEVRDADGKLQPGPLPTAQVHIHDTRFLDRKVFGIPDGAPVPQDKRVVYGMDQESASYKFEEIARKGNSHGHPIQFVFFELSGFDGNRKGAKTKDLLADLRKFMPDTVVGFYHFFGAANDPAVQAKVFLEEFQAATGGSSLVGFLPPVLDLEERPPNPKIPGATVSVAGPDFLKNALKWIGIVKQALTPKDVEPIIYTQTTSWDIYETRFRGSMKDLAHTAFSKSLLWITEAIPYRQRKMPEKVAFKDRKDGQSGLANGGWPHWTFWQFSVPVDNDHPGPPIPGVGGPVDHDVFFGTFDQLKKLVVK